MPDRACDFSVWACTYFSSSIHKLYRACTNIGWAHENFSKAHKSLEPHARWACNVKPCDVKRHGWKLITLEHSCWDNRDMSPGANPLSESMLNIVNFTLRENLQWNVNGNSYIFIQENAFKNFVCRIAAILSQLQCIQLKMPIGDTVRNQGPVSISRPSFPDMGFPCWR